MACLHIIFEILALLLFSYTVHVFILSWDMPLKLSIISSLPVYLFDQIKSIQKRVLTIIHREASSRKALADAI